MRGRGDRSKSNIRGSGHVRSHTERQSRKPSPIKIPESSEGIPIFFPPHSRSHDATKNGVQVVKEKLVRYLSKHYGRFGRFLVDDAYYVEPDPRRPALGLDPDFEESVVEWKVYESGCVESAKQNRQSERDKVAWFSIILGLLSQESEDLVQAEDDWEDTNNEQDPLELWRIVERTHLTRVTGSTALDRDNAMREYNKVRHYESGDTLPEYKKRHERAIEALERVEHPHIPSEEMQVIKWIKGLNNKYKEWKYKTLNEIRAGDDPPATLEDAMRLRRNNFRVSFNFLNI